MNVIMLDNVRVTLTDSRLLVFFLLMFSLVVFLYAVFQIADLFLCILYSGIDPLSN